MSRIAKTDVHAALQRAANHIMDAAGPDGVASRKDIKAKLAELKGDERELVDTFYRFVDHRDAGSGARITQKDVDRAVVYAKAKLVDKYDLNNNGLSAGEIAEMSRTGQLAAQLARDLQTVATPGRGLEALSAELKALLEPGCLKLEVEDGNFASVRVMDVWDNEGMKPVETMRRLLALPEAKELREIVLGLAEADGGADYSELVKTVAESGPHTGVKEMVVGDFTGDECEISWATLSDISSLYEALPNLEKLRTHGGKLGLGKLEHPTLKELVIETGGLPREAVDAIGNAKLPSVEKLEVWFGAEEYGAGGSAEQLRPLLSGDGCPRLKDLGLMNAEFQNDIVKELVGSSLLGKLEDLNLSLGTMTDEGAQLILDNAHKFGHLKSLNLDENYLSEGMCARLHDAFGDRVKTGDQKLEDQYDDNDFYVSVGE